MRTAVSKKVIKRFKKDIPIVNENFICTCVDSYSSGVYKISGEVQVELENGKTISAFLTDLIAE